MALPNEPIDLVHPPISFSPFVQDFKTGTPSPTPPTGKFIVSEITRAYLITEITSKRMVTER